MISLVNAMFAIVRDGKHIVCTLLDWSGLRKNEQNSWYLLLLYIHISGPARNHQQFLGTPPFLLSPIADPTMDSYRCWFDVNVNVMLMLMLMLM